jgi:hypothetical protein
MDAGEIRRICRRITPHAFTDVLARDEFTELRRGQYAIVNSLPASDTVTMGHWVYVERLLNGDYAAFDSLGAPSVPLPVTVSLKSSRKVQCANAVTCAHHCIFFAYLRHCMLLSFTECLRHAYSHDCRYNDAKVRAFINKIN